MKNIKLILIVSVILTALLLALEINVKLTRTSLTPKKNASKIILIDPGHGGIDGGATSDSGTCEKNINLSIGLMLKDCLQKKGYIVAMTREDDRALYNPDKKTGSKKSEDLENRCKLKVTSKCDMFISIHLNMFPERQYYGAQVWYSKYPESKTLAELVQSNLIKDLDERNKRIEKPAGNQYKILRTNDTMPGIIVECGFLSNPREEGLLKSEEYQKKIAESICNSVHEFYKNKQE